MTLHRHDQQRLRRLEPFAADPVSGFPQNDERLPNSLVVDALTRSSLRRLGRAAI
jgi:hypothetical protein